jgi:hypothetical protein
MKRFLRWQNILALLLIATLVKFWSYNLMSSGLTDGKQLSSRSSQSKGVYVCAVHANPSTFLWKGILVTIQDVWIERQVLTDHPYIWFSRITPTGRYILCISLHTDKSLFSDADSFNLVCDDSDFGGIHTGTGYMPGWGENTVGIVGKAGVLEKHGTALTIQNRQLDGSNPPTIKLTW